MKIKKLPTDNPSNFYLETDETKEHLINWIRENLVESGGTWKGSYELREIYSSLTNNYISNGSFKEAMRISGYKVQDETALKNWGFKVNKRSPAILKFYEKERR